MTTTETCCVHTDHGTPVSLSVADRTCIVPHHATPDADAAEVLSVLGFEVLGHLRWVNRTLSILAVRRVVP